VTLAFGLLGTLLLQFARRPYAKALQEMDARIAAGAEN